jgi:hypothetical protein
MSGGDKCYGENEHIKGRRELQVWEGAVAIV